MNDLKKILDSFKQRKSLSPKIWVKKDGNIKLNPKVRSKLLDISYDFIEFIGVDIIVSDIIITGSLANYNWSNFSDVDLHILVDFEQFPKDQVELYKELFLLKKTLYNDKHDIIIYGYDVELYVQNEKESHFSSGIYSVLNDEWLNKPKKENVTIDTKLISSKSKQWMGMIDNVIENIKDEPVEKAKDTLKKFKEKLKKYRTCGLEKEGEYSDENLVFKVLRRNGYIQKLFDFENDLLDKKYSLKEATTNIGGSFATDIEYSPASHAKRMFGNWESDNAWDVFAPVGSVVNSYTEGTVTKVKDTGKKSGKIYGTQVKIKGEGGFPDIFYTHIKDVNIRPGDIVKVGDYIGKVTEWCQDEDCTKKLPNTHVHIGLPRGRHLRELLVNSDKIFTGAGSSVQQKDDEKVKEEILTTVEKTYDVNKDKVEDKVEEISKKQTGILSAFFKLIKSNRELRNLKGLDLTIPYDKDVEIVQSGLQFLGYSLPKWGIDGKFGPETEKAVKSFEKDNGLTEDGILKSEDIQKLLVLLINKDFEDSDLSSLQKTSEFEQIKVGSDNDFYIAILKGIGAPVTKENLKFFYAWRQAEGGKAKNNPFNTTQNMKNDTGISNYNKVGVKNYSTPQIGIEATIKTLKNGRYSCIVDGLKNDIGAENISQCSKALSTWGTGMGIANVLRGKINPPSIYA